MNNIIGYYYEQHFRLILLQLITTLVYGAQQYFTEQASIWSGSTNVPKGQESQSIHLLKTCIKSQITVTIITMVMSSSKIASLMLEYLMIEQLSERLLATDNLTLAQASQMAQQAEERSKDKVIVCRAIVL